MGRRMSQGPAISVLIVDDSATMRRSVAYVLGHEGYAIHEACDGQAALERLASLGDVDLVITDLNMPRLDGIGFIRKARELPAFRFTPILILSTESQAALVAEGRKAGATGWIVKPFDTAKLLAAVRKLAG